MMVCTEGGSEVVETVQLIWCLASRYIYYKYDY